MKIYLASTFPYQLLPIGSRTRELHSKDEVGMSAIIYQLTPPGIGGIPLTVRASAGHSREEIE